MDELSWTEIHNWNLCIKLTEIELELSLFFHTTKIQLY